MWKENNIIQKPVFHNPSWNNWFRQNSSVYVTVSWKVDGKPYTTELMAIWTHHHLQLYSREGQASRTCFLRSTTGNTRHLRRYLVLHSSSPSGIKSNQTFRFSEWKHKGWRKKVKRCSILQDKMNLLLCRWYQKNKIKRERERFKK